MRVESALGEIVADTGFASSLSANFRATLCKIAASEIVPNAEPKPSGNRSQITLNGGQSHSKIVFETRSPKNVQHDNKVAPKVLKVEPSGPPGSPGVPKVLKNVQKDELGKRPGTQVGPKVAQVPSRGLFLRGF